MRALGQSWFEAFYQNDLIFEDTFNNQSSYEDILYVIIWFLVLVTDRLYSPFIHLVAL